MATSGDADRFDLIENEIHLLASLLFYKFPIAINPYSWGEPVFIRSRQKRYEDKIAHAPSNWAEGKRAGDLRVNRCQLKITSAAHRDRRDLDARNRVNRDRSHVTSMTRRNAIIKVLRAGAKASHFQKKRIRQQRPASF
jgi:hypothetical protein